MTIDPVISTEIPVSPKSNEQGQAPSANEPQNSENTAQFMTLRSEEYLKRFGEEIPDFDEYMENMNTLRRESKS